MHLVCPECGETIPANNINVQKLIAVCPACAAVFPFDLPHDHPKRRKVKPPQDMRIDEDDDRLHLVFHTGTSLEQNQTTAALFLMTLLAALLTVLLGMSYGTALTGTGGLLLVLGAGFFTLSFAYGVLLGLLNRTHVDVTRETIHVAHRPFPALHQHESVAVSDVQRIVCERIVTVTPDTPKYRVQAELTDGSPHMIVNGVTERYAYFVAQCIQQHLDETLPDIARLCDPAERPDEQPDEQDAPASRRHDMKQSR